MAEKPPRPEQLNTCICVGTLILFEEFAKSLVLEGEFPKSTSTMRIGLTDYKGQFLVYDPKNTEEPFYFTGEPIDQVQILLEVRKDTNRQKSSTAQTVFREAIGRLIHHIFNREPTQQPQIGQNPQLKSIWDTSTVLKNQDLLNELFGEIQDAYSQKEPGETEVYTKDLIINAIANQISRLSIQETLASERSPQVNDIHMQYT